jgi:hypothetical protein
VKNKTLWPVVLILVFAFSRWPGAMPQNFSAAYALCFCAGLYLPRKLAWALPLGVVLITDLFLTFGYYHLAGYTLANFLRDQAPIYLSYALIIWLGTLLGGKKRSFFTLLSGGILGAILFYLISNTAAWLTSAEYGKTLTEWVRALTVGDPKYHPTTWEFFRGTFLSGGLFTGLFVGAMKFSESRDESPVEKGEEAPEADSEEPEPSLTPASDDARRAAS